MNSCLTVVTQYVLYVIDAEVIEYKSYNWRLNEEIKIN